MGTAIGFAPLKDSRAQLGGLGKLKLPDGRELDAVGGAELARILIQEGVPGVSHENGRMKKVEAYFGYLDAIERKAAAEAVAARLRQRHGGG